MVNFLLEIRWRLRIGDAETSSTFQHKFHRSVTTEKPNCNLTKNHLTYWGRDKIDAISQTTSSSAFSLMKMFEFRLKFHWSLFLRVQLTIFQHWFRWWLGAVQATSHYLNQWWLVYWRIYASLGLNELRGSSSVVKHLTAPRLESFVAVRIDWCQY